MVTARITNEGGTDAGYSLPTRWSEEQQDWVRTSDGEPIDRFSRLKIELSDEIRAVLQQKANAVDNAVNAEDEGERRAWQEKARAYSIVRKSLEDAELWLTKVQS